MKTLFALPESARVELHRRYSKIIKVNRALSRALVSYQSNRGRARYRWFKYKEGFSAALVEYLLGQLGITSGRLLDPFAGTGAAMFVAREHGLASDGIELLPVGVKVIEARLKAERVCRREFRRVVSKIAGGAWRRRSDPALAFRHLRITEGAFPAETEQALTQFRTYIRDGVRSDDIRQVLDLASLSILESVSYTRKDGQYLRWDSRAPRKLPGKTFDKGPILDFEAALLGRLREMADDLDEYDLFAETARTDAAPINVHHGSCLHVLPELPTRTYDAVITSPPYCNRYDYTRTYALELAYLGINEPRLKELRQALLSCTVENRSKIEELQCLYARNCRSDDLDAAIHAFEHQAALQEVLGLLERKGEHGELNNTNVPRMVRNYFLESAVTIFEWARIVKPGGCVAMVNDNVQYGGEEVPVDLILSDLAAQAGFKTESIWALDRGKGNSSQQMGTHGRNELRKCVYVWRRD